MATNASEHLGLHLWEPTDQVLRTEFNENWQKIDTAAAEAQGIAERAQTTADAAYSSGNKPFVVGNYTGTGKDVTISLGFKPSFLIVCGHAATDALNTDEKILYAFTATGGHVITGRIQLLPQDSLPAPEVPAGAIPTYLSAAGLMTISHFDNR